MNNPLAENSVTQLLNSVKLARDNAERDDNRVDHSFYYALARALEELQERRKAAMDSEPVAWRWRWSDDAEGYWRYTEEQRETRGSVTAQPLYRHAQQPVVPDRSIFEKWWKSQNGAPLDGWDSLRATDGYCDDGIDGQFEAWNAAMLAAAPQGVPDGK